MYADYDLIADQYVALFQDEKSLAEDRELFQRWIRPQGRTLDVGCGHGLVLDYFDFDHYVGIDPSDKMLQHLIRRYPHRRRDVFCCRFEDYYGAGFDTILATYGTASYIDPDVLNERIPKMLNPNGKAFLMFYKPGYEPETYKLTGVQMDFYPTVATGIEFNNYIISIVTRGAKNEKNSVQDNRVKAGCMAKP